MSLPWSPAVEVEVASAPRPATAAAPITAAILYDVVQCPHRVHLDRFGDQSRRDPVSPFVALLWKRGSLHEREVVAGLTGDPTLVDLSRWSGEEEARTLDAMRAAVPMIYSGRIRADGLLGEPDLLRKELGGYVPGDIKSGTGEEGADEDGEGGKPKKHYAVQLGLYVDVLERLGLSAGRRGFVWDIKGAETTYDFLLPRGPKSPDTLWDAYLNARTLAAGILAGPIDALGAYSATCKLCHWYTWCVAYLTAADDLTLIPALGRAVRDSMSDRIGTIAELAEIQVDGFVVGNKTVFRGLGPDRLDLFRRRAAMLKSSEPKAYLRAPVSIPTAYRELFFDIEVDPLRDVTYLHGFVERLGGDNPGERFVAFFAEEANARDERAAFAAAWAFIVASQPCVTFYYSKYERTIYRKLRARYPDVCTAEEIERFFDPSRSVDLYCDVVLKATEWPTRDFSIKTLARYLGFAWRDTQPSGAASIEWYDRWIRTGDPAVRQRILDYNEDDCVATRVLLDGIRALDPWSGDDDP